VDNGVEELQLEVGNFNYIIEFDSLAIMDNHQHILVNLNWKHTEVDGESYTDAEDFNNSLITLMG
jgi:hypothetical protein